MVKCYCLVLYNVLGSSILSADVIELCFVKTQGFEFRPPVGLMKASLQNKLVSAVIPK